MSSVLPPFPAQPGGDEVDRVICASVATDRANVYATLEKIRDRALRHNPSVGVNAALLYQSGWFLHWAEGPSAAVRHLFERIGQDGRHHSQYVVHYSRGRRLLVTPWSMMMSPSTESAGDFGGRVMQMRQRLSEGVQYSPPSVIRRLSAPMRLPQAQGMTDPEAFHRVGVCAAAGNDAFDLVHSLARQHGVAAASRRFAGATDLDSGSDMVDFMRGDLPCRVIAVPRADLAHGLRRAYMPDWRFLMLLASGDPRRDDALLERVAEAFHGLPCTPDLLAVAPDAAALAAFAAQAAARGLTLAGQDVAPAGDASALWSVAQRELEAAGDPPSSAWDVFEPLPLA